MAPNYVAVRARTLIPLAGEEPARGMAALAAPLARLNDAVIVGARGGIVAVEPYADFCRRVNIGAVALTDLGDVVVTPGLVNCHTHLELSHMVGKTVLGRGFCDWIASLLAQDSPVTEGAIEAMRAAACDMVRAGTAAVGDITDRMPREALGAACTAGLDARVFFEIFGHDPERATAATATATANAAFSLAGHALYSTAGAAMARARSWCASRGLPFSLHLAEHEDEDECLRSGSGRLHAMLARRVLPAGWRAPGMGPVAWATSLGLLAPGTVAVHCVRCDAKDITLLVQSGCGVCLCPRSNAAMAVGEAPARALAEKGALLVLGTDSLASNTDLHVWKEAEFFLQKNILPGNALLRMATVNGAFVLRYFQRVGTLEKGKRFCYTVFPSETNSFFR